MHVLTGHIDDRLSASEAQRTRKLFPNGCSLSAAAHRPRNELCSRRNRKNRKRFESVKRT